MTKYPWVQATDGEAHQGNQGGRKGMVEGMNRAHPAAQFGDEDQTRQDCRGINQ
jgi:hypothetical protein